MNPSNLEIDMSIAARIVIIALVLGAAASVFVLCGESKDLPLPAQVDPNLEASKAPAPVAPVKALPKLMDLGSTTCIPCKKMDPILANLAAQYRGYLEVEFINVSENREAATRHGIRLIPTQIFFDADGRELYRHEGFMAEDAILAKWQELGVELVARQES
jgi:thioredoxin 1